MCRSVLLVIGSLFSLLGSTLAQSPDPAIVGHWVVLNRSKGGLGSMLEFKKDGTLQMALGAVVDDSYKIDGDKLILPSATTGPNAKAQIIKIKIVGDTMYEKPEDDPNAGEQKFVRISAAKAGEAPIVGTWKHADAQSEKMEPAMREAGKNATYTYTRDGILKLRMPFQFLPGTYDAAARSFTLNFAGRAVKGTFRMENGKLYVSKANSQTEEVYVREDGE